MVDQTQEREPGTPTSGVVHGDRPCLNCGYNLKGLPVDGLCPECGREKGPSLEAWGPAAWSRGYVRRLWWGATLTIWGMGLGLAVLIVDWWFLEALPRRTMIHHIGQFRVLWLAALALFAVGIWLLSSRPPHARPRKQGARTRMLLRLCLAALLLSAVWAHRLLGEYPSALGPAWMTVGTDALLMIFASACAVYLVSLLYLWRIGTWMTSDYVCRGVSWSALGGAVLSCGTFTAIPVLLASEVKLQWWPLSKQAFDWAVWLLLVATPVLPSLLYIRAVHRLRRELTKLTNPRPPHPEPYVPQHEQ